MIVGRAVLAPAPGRLGVSDEEMRLRAENAALRAERDALKARLDAANEHQPAPSLTTDQARAYEVIRDHMARNGGVPPKMRDLATLLGLKSSSGAARAVRELERRGALTRDRGRQQSIALVARPGHAPAAAGNA